MNKKTVKIILILLSILIASGFLFKSLVFTNGILKSNIKRNGMDILLPDEDICSFAITGGILWAGGTTGLFKINMNTLVAEKAGDYKFIRAVLAVGGGLWIGHDNGLTYIRDTTLDKGSDTLSVDNSFTYTTKDGLPDNRVNSIIFDRDKHLWVGTWGGVTEIYEGKFRTYTVKDGLLDNMVNVIMQDSFGGMWFGSYVAPRGGISVLYKEKWSYFTTKDALLHANISAIIQIGDKSVIAGGGLYTKGGGTRFVLKYDKWVKSGYLTKKDGLMGEKIRSIFEDSQDRLWVGSEYDGLAVFSKNRIIKMTKKTGLSNDEVKIITEDDKKNIWIGTRRGLTRISKGGLQDEQ